MWGGGDLKKILYFKNILCPPPSCSIHNECITGYDVHTVLVKFSTVPVACVASVSNRVIARKFFFALVPTFLHELAQKRLLRRLPYRLKS